MGVLMCARKGCGNVMCDNYSYQYDYICNSCLDELISMGVDTDIEEFLRSRNSYKQENKAEDYFREIFQKQNR